MKISLSMIQLNNFTPLAENKYDKNILRDENERGFFLTHTYFRDSNKKFYIPAFSLQFENDDTGGHYDLAFSANREGANFKLFQHKNDLYFDNELGFSTAGLTYIFILKNGKFYGAPHKLVVVPGEMTLAEYEAMIREILFIRSELLQKGDTNLKAVFSEKTKPLREVNNLEVVLQYLSRQIEKLLRLMKKINQQPRHSIKKYQNSCPLQKIHHFDEKILQQYFHGQKNYRVQESAFSLDIFENRLLLDKLTRLKIFLEKQNLQWTSNTKNTFKNISYEIQSIVGNFKENELTAKWYDYSQAKYKAWKSFEDKKFNIAKKFRANLVARQVTPANLVTQTLKFTFEKIEAARIYADSGLEIYLRTRSGNWKELTSHISDPAQQLAIFKTFTENNSDKKTIELTGKFDFDGDEIFIYALEKIIFNGEIINFESDADKKLEEIYVAQEIEKHNGYERALMNYRAVQEINQRLNKNNRKAETENLFGKILENLNACLALKVFRGLKVKNERWHMTQIFTNDANYHRAYIKLRELDEVFDFSFDAEDKNIPAQTMFQIYEWWILAKIIEFLVVKLNWHVEGGGDNPVEIFRSLFSGDKSLTQGKICLARPDMDMELYYNVDINESIGASNRKLRPDYLFKVTTDTETKIFILDAKYRNYEAQGETIWINDDLKGVCANKYIHEIKNLTGENVSMSFIVHPDKTRGKNFLGKYVTYNATVEPQLKELFKKIPGAKQQIGSFYLLPYDGENLNQSEINLSLFFKMMFEYFLGCWTKCWECGSDLVEITPLLTNGGYEKYYMRCEKCGAFWVKTHCHSCHNHLVKHYINYHVENNGNWLVLCPKCGK